MTNTIMNWFRQNWLYFAGAASGAIAGFLYWKYIGCLSGTCAITSDPTNSTLYFALMGALIFGMFKREKKNEPS